ncbi:MAG: lytic transglycosylase domain-containing protein [Paracoccus sp. (in: a-proteobacteria)]|uniref:lytic transglycosylase domain-containing protein n=1 Tax=Paracoccus sp. TaxID=267 RepID=UPI0026E0A387|nr:lytic transglycosylase domain-containing protein [Paracoccus sp. (in: a-proteobacteria)]MDO5622129.1 lytic transglycosylase domain-containing protein [Paracoccus sp. (in: a-proteobacteria)]
MRRFPVLLRFAPVCRPHRQSVIRQHASRWSGRLLAGLLALAVPAQPTLAHEAVDARLGLAPVRQSDDRRCTDDGATCIGLETYVPDVCRVIERASTENGLDPNFLARLLWKESLFEPGAISPAGAQGIAQFMPETAKIVGLDDPFNPAKAILTSARYLKSLTDGFGNIGLAAVAYNGGENRAARFQGGSQVLPYETQDYVEAITGHNAWAWRDNPPGPDKLNLVLDPDLPFHDACVKLAGNRTLREFKTERRASPWGVIIASHPTRAGAQRMASRIRPALDGQQVAYVRRKIAGNPRMLYTAQVGYQSRAEAARFCARLQNIGARCIVLRN